MYGHRWQQICSMTALIVGLLACWSVPAQGTVLIQEDSFEGSGPAADGWNYIQSYCNSSPCPYLDVSTDVFHAGSKSLKGTFNAAWSDPITQINTVGVSHQFPAGTWKDVYIRYWHYTKGFRYNIPSTKKFVMLSASVPGSNDPRFISVHWYGSRDLGYVNEYPTGGGPTRFDLNMSSAPLVDLQWQCVIEHIKYNTPGINNGVLEIWVDGVQTLGYYNQQFQSTGHDGRFTGVQYYKQNGSGTLDKAQAGFSGSGPASGYGVQYVDQFTAATTRSEVACGGGGGDTTPPNQPRNFIVN